MLLRILLALALVIASAASAAAQPFGASAETANDGSGSYTIAVGSAVAAGDALVVVVRQSEETSTVTSLSDSVNGGSIANWTCASGDDGGGTARVHICMRTGSGAGTPTISIGLSAGAGGERRAFAIPAAIAATFEGWASPNIQGSATSPLTTPTGTATCVAGVAVGVIWSNSARDVSSVDVGTNLSPITGRLHIVYLPFSSAGSVGPINATMSATARGISHLGIFCAPGGPSTVDLDNPSFAVQGTTISADLNDDGYTFAAQKPLMIDQYGKLIAWAERVNAGNSRHRPIVSNNGGATWTDVSISGMFDSDGEGFLNRAACDLDTVNDLMHCLWEAAAHSDGMIYRRYSFTRDGSNNITAVARVSGVSLQLDADSGYEGLFHPAILWQNAGGAHGQILCVWGAYNSGGSPNRAELRASMRVLSNTTADATAGNWKAPVTDDATTISIDAFVPYSILYSRSTTGAAPHAGIHRKRANTHINDIYVGVHDGNSSSSGGAWRMLRLPWDAGNADWSNTIVSVSLDNLLVAGTDGGYSLKNQLGSQVSEDIVNDRVWLGYALWLSDVAGDTWAARYVDASDTASARVVAYSAGGAHSYAPTGDLVCDPATGRVAIAYIKTSTDHVYVQVYDGTTQYQVETLMFNAEAVDIPLLWSGGRTSADTLPVLFRSSTGTPTPPYDGYYGTMDWAAAPAGGGFPQGLQQLLLRSGP